MLYKRQSDSKSVKRSYVNTISLLESDEGIGRKKPKKQKNHSAKASVSHSRPIIVEEYKFSPIINISETEEELVDKSMCGKKNSQENVFLSRKVVESFSSMAGSLSALETNVETISENLSRMSRLRLPSNPFIPKKDIKIYESVFNRIVRDGSIRTLMTHQELVGLSTGSCIREKKRKMGSMQRKRLRKRLRREAEAGIIVAPSVQSPCGVSAISGDSVVGASSGDAVVGASSADAVVGVGADESMGDVGYISLNWDWTESWILSGDWVNG